MGRNGFDDADDGEHGVVVSGNGIVRDGRSLWNADCFSRQWYSSNSVWFGNGESEHGVGRSRFESWERTSGRADEGDGFQRERAVFLKHSQVGAGD